MTESGVHPQHGASAAPGGDHAAGRNPEVRYERSDVQARGVVTFVAALAVLIVASGAMLVWLFRHYERDAEAANARAVLPLAKGERDRLPSSPRLEGIDPAEDVGRARADGTHPAGGALPWFGYNVRVVPPDVPRDAGADPEERDRVAALEMEKKLRKVDQELARLAGTFKVRADSPGMPADTLRRSAGESNSGRAASGKLP